MVAEFRESDDQTPVLLMGYVNPIERMGYEPFCQAASAAGVDATLIVNLPPEEGELLDQSLLAYGLDSICLLAPTTTDQRAKYLCKKSRGFIYYVSLKGTTGAALIDMDAVEQRVRSLRQYSSIPMVVGFGIKDGDSAARVASFCDGSVIGTAIVSLFESLQYEPHRIAPAVGKLVQQMRQAMDNTATS
jgi:tryptophan synthase alpha chain